MKTNKLLAGLAGLFALLASQLTQAGPTVVDVTRTMKAAMERKIFAPETD